MDRINEVKLKVGENKVPPEGDCISKQAQQDALEKLKQAKIEILEEVLKRIEFVEQTTEHDRGINIGIMGAFYTIYDLLEELKKPQKVHIKSNGAISL